MSPLDLAGIPLGRHVSPHKIRCPNCSTIQESDASPVESKSNTLIYKCDTCGKLFKIKT